MANIFTNFFNRNKQSEVNAFNRAFYQLLGGASTKYDQNNKTYLEKGYNINPDVYSIINKQSLKTVSVPYSIKKVSDNSNQIININFFTRLTRSTCFTGLFIGNFHN